EISLAAAWAGFPVVVVGLVVGYLSGASREPAVSALIPAVLTLVGGAGLYLVGKGPLRATQVAFILIVFASTLFLGANIGSQSRTEAVAATESVESLKAAADRDFLVGLYRKGLGLPPATSSENASGQ